MHTACRQVMTTDVDGSWIYAWSNADSRPDMKHSSSQTYPKRGLVADPTTSSEILVSRRPCAPSNYLSIFIVRIHSNTLSSTHTRRRHYNDKGTAEVSRHSQFPPSVLNNVFRAPAHHLLFTHPYPERISTAHRGPLVHRKCADSCRSRWGRKHTRTPIRYDTVKGFRGRISHRLRACTPRSISPVDAGRIS